jgi:hypothetical protein
MNPPAMPGRLLTWREWLDDYDPIEVDYGGGIITAKRLIMPWLAIVCETSGTVIGDEWRSVDGRWSMRGKAVERVEETQRGNA